MRLFLAEINAPKKQLPININHTKVPNSACNVKQQHANAINAFIIAPSQ